MRYPLTIPMWEGAHKSTVLRIALMLYRQMDKRKGANKKRVCTTMIICIHSTKMVHASGSGIVPCTFHVITVAGRIPGSNDVDLEDTLLLAHC